MIFRIFNIVVIGALILAAAYVYRIKFASTVQAEHLAKLRGEVRRERDRIAAFDPARRQRRRQPAAAFERLAPAVPPLPMHDGEPVWIDRCAATRNPIGVKGT